MDWAKEHGERKIGTILYLVFLAFMCILVFLFTGIITGLSSFLPILGLNYIIFVIGSLIMGGLVFSFIHKITKSELKILLAGIICPFTGILNLLLVRNILLDVATTLKDNLQNTVMMFNGSFLNPDAAVHPLAASIIFYLVFNLVFIIHIQRKKEHMLFKWYALAPVVFLLAAVVAKFVYEYYVGLGALIV